MFHYVRRHTNTIVFRLSTFDYLFVVLRHPFRKRRIGLNTLVFDHRAHRGVLQLQIPFRQRPLNRFPFLYRTRRIDHIGYIAPFLPVVLLHLLRHNRLLMNMFLQAKQNLTRVHGFNQVIGDLLSDGLLHDMLFLRFGNHHHRHLRMNTLDLLQRLQTRHTRHVLIQEHDIKGTTIDFRLLTFD